MAEKNINNLPIIEETSLHRIVEMVKNNDDTLLVDSRTGKCVKTSVYLGVNVDDQGKVIKIYAKRPFYWKCWDFEKDIERKDMDKPIKINKKEIYKKRLSEDFISDKREENEKNPFAQYDFAIDFFGIEIGLVRSFCNIDNGKIYFYNRVIFDEATFSGETNFNRVVFSREAYFLGATFSGETDFGRAIFSGLANFKRATFSCKVDFYDVTFYNQVGFDFVIFFSEAKFSSTTFSGAVSSYRATFSSEANFSNATFSSKIIFVEATFSGEANFNRAIFYSNVYFWRAIFSGEASFCQATFSSEIDFSTAIFFDKAIFAYATFSGGVYMTDLKFNSNELFVDFSNCTIEDKIIFGLSEDSADVYKKLIFSFYCSNINYFICDDKALEYIQLYWHNPTREDDKRLGKKTKIERYIHELRVMRKIYQDLLWGDVADDYYARLMDEQMKLELYELWRDYPRFLISMHEFFNQPIHKIDKRLLSKKSSYIRYLKELLSKKIFMTFRLLLLKRAIFQYGFGWGVRLKNISLTGVGIIIFFSLIYWSQKISYYIGSDAIMMNTQNFLHSFLFSVWTFFNIFLPDLQVISLSEFSASLFLITTESLLGIIWMTLLVAILARKFMRL